MTTITLKVPDELAARLPASDAERERYILEVLSEKVGLDKGDEEEPLTEPARSGRRLHSPLEFAGVGAGRPGAIVGDAQEYVSRLRDEWERDDAA